MLQRRFPDKRQQCFVFQSLAVAAAFGILPDPVGAQQAKVEFLHIGTSGTLTAEKEGSKEKAALMTLQSFLKDETGLNNEIVRHKDWSELGEKMSKGQLQIGVFQGYEFAWAQEQYPDLKPLALAVNLYRYPTVYVVTRRDDTAKNFAGLQGHSLCLPDTGQAALRLFVERESQTAGKDLKDFFSKVTFDPSVEDALDNLVDGMVDAVVVDRAALEAYKQRKPGRFAQLKEVAKSPPLPPVVIAYYDKRLDEATLKHFRESLLAAGQTEKGKTLLTLFHLTGFDAIPGDFGKVLAETRKTYPAPKLASK